MLSSNLYAILGLISAGAYILFRIFANISGFFRDRADAAIASKQQKLDKIQGELNALHKNNKIDIDRYNQLKSEYDRLSAEPSDPATGGPKGIA